MIGAGKRNMTRKPGSEKRVLIFRVTFADSTTLENRFAPKL